ncbi:MULTISPECIES: secretin N-terminal domain-containing protein [unclassified Paludibacterium]|uniref:secretin N-terminal domain-containing protein n=1 Tax=unclassified Paludibacterium TaxID=2618429 RepID=UPI001C04882B|nr:secretin N-terminal domain-containing protein [Paludibacterium sp. B53371]BEV73042.1 tetratricopeptide repeat protein [Paludibacterium sp. THUN1379]
MKQMNKPPFPTRQGMVSVMMLSLLLAGCSVDRALMASKTLYQEGDLEGALTRIEQTMKAEPDNMQLRAEHERLLAQYDAQKLALADKALAAGDMTAAGQGYRSVLQHDPASYRAEQGLKAIDNRQLHQQWMAQARSLAAQDPGAALDWLGKILAEEPTWQEALDFRESLMRTAGQGQLSSNVPAALKKPVSLSFRNQSLNTVFDAISRMTGLNFIFDSDVSPGLRATITTQKSTAWDAINLLLATSKLSKKLLNSNTLLIYPSRPEKEREYQDLGVRTYYLSNADPKQVLNTLKQVLKPRDIAIDERLNAVVLRDVPSVLAAADRMVQSLDLPQSEVTLDVEVLEVSDTLARNLGINYPGSVGIGFANSGTDGSTSLSGQTTIEKLRHLNGSGIGVSMGSNGVVGGINLSETNDKVHTLANPKIRVKNHQKATIKIGEKLPIVTSTLTTAGSSSSVSYQDVGLTLNVEPSISLGQEVSVNVSLEVSDVIGQPTTMSDGTMVYRLGNRSASTVLSTRDNVTQVLGGLIKRDDSVKDVGLPFLSEIPLLKSLFGSHDSNDLNSQIVLLITPHIVRQFSPPPAALTRFSIGPENRIGDPLQLGENAGQVSVRANGASVTDDTPGVSAPRRNDPPPPPPPESVAGDGPAPMPFFRGPMPVTPPDDKR